MTSRITRKGYKRFCRSETAKTWDDLYRFRYEILPKSSTNVEWIFRGDTIAFKRGSRDIFWPGAFKSNLEKDFDRFDVKEASKRVSIERYLIREFRRRVSLHTRVRPANWLESLALMQHHGAPTRMLDWTYSFAVAVYFAVARSTKEDGVVWALNNDWMVERAHQVEERFIAGDTTLRALRDDDKGDFKNRLIHHLMKDGWPEAFVYTVNPYYLNKRLTVQRGVFLFPSDLHHGRSWTDNIKGMLERERNGARVLLYKVRIPYDSSARRSIIERLHDMNINQASLFPDLDGFAQSLRTRIAHPPKGWLPKT